MRLASLLAAAVLACGLQLATAQTAVVVRPPAAPGPTVVAVVPAAPVARVAARPVVRRAARKQARRAARKQARRSARRTARRVARRS